jgi:hypothetical protein
MNTIRELQTLTHTCSPWVRFYALNFLLHFSSPQVLDPRKKFAHFKNHWSEELQDEARVNMEETVVCYILHTVQAN